MTNKEMRKYTMIKKVKRTIKGIITITIMTLAIGYIGYNDTHYTTNGTVVKTYDNKTDIEVANGNIYTIDGEISHDTTKVELVMCNNDTLNDFEDDIVCQVKEVR